MIKKSELKTFFLFLALNIILIMVSTLQAQDLKKNTNNCLRCHGMKTLSYQDSIAGGIISLYVNPEKYQHSVHKRLTCTECHTNNGYYTFPHAPSVKSEKLSCLDCHQEGKKFSSFHFKQKEKEFKESIHHKKLKENFDCFSCHNPHDFNTTRGVRSTSKIIKLDNQICLDCHESNLSTHSLRNGNSENLYAAHNWLPKTKLHWNSVRCIECHVSPGKELSHTILAKEEALKNCESCHSKNSVLLDKLYTFRAEESRQKKGILAALFHNTPYVVGMSRNPLIDQLSIIIFILTILALSAHGFGRWLGNRRKDQ
jgi:nitrate reductase cytochrome c-type subunit